MSIVFEDGVDINRPRQKGTLIDWSFLDRMKVDQSLLVDRVEFSDKTGWPQCYDFSDPSKEAELNYYPIADIRQHFCSQMKKRGYGYVTRTIEKDKSFRVWRTS